MAEESPNTAQDAHEGLNRAPRGVQEPHERPQALPDVSDIHVGCVQRLGAALRTARKWPKSVPRRVKRPMMGPNIAQQGSRGHMRGRSCCRTFLTSMSAVTGDSAGPPEQTQNGPRASQDAEEELNRARRGAQGAHEGRMGRKRCRTLLTSMSALSGDSPRPPEQARNGPRASEDSPGGP